MTAVLTSQNALLFQNGVRGLAGGTRTEGHVIGTASTQTQSGGLGTVQGTGDCLGTVDAPCPLHTHTHTRLSRCEYTVDMCPVTPVLVSGYQSVYVYIQFQDTRCVFCLIVVVMYVSILSQYCDVIK